MAIQQDPSKSFGSTSYFQNKDEQRRVVNDMRREQRNKRIAQQGLTRNIKRAIRKGENPNAYIDAAKQMGLDPLGGGGLGPEASQRDAALRAKAASLFEEASQLRKKSDSTVSKQGVATPSGGTVSESPAVNPANVDAASAQPVEPVATGVISNKPKEPEWFTGDVKKDTTFRGVDLTESRFIGKTREEARQMVMSDKANKAMAQFDKDGQALAQKEKDAAFAVEKQELDRQGAIASEQVKQMDIDKRTKAALNPENIANQKNESMRINQDANALFDRFDSNLNTLTNVVGGLDKLNDKASERPARLADIQNRATNEIQTNESRIFDEAKAQIAIDRQKDSEAQIQRNQKVNYDLGMEVNRLYAESNKETSALQNRFKYSTKGKVYNAGEAIADAIANKAKSIVANAAVTTYSVFKPYVIK
jgi:hypothetical protein